MRRQRKSDPLAEARIRFVDYKDDRLLSRFIGETGKLLPSRLTGVTARHQRQIAKAIKKGETVSITGFGNFEQRQRGARTFRNPRTGDPVKAKAMKVPAFRAGATLRATIRGGAGRAAAGKKAAK